MFAWIKKALGEEVKEEAGNGLVQFGGKLALDTANVAKPRKHRENFKVAFVGPSGTGKSSIVTRISDGRFLCERYCSTIGCDFKTKEIITHGRRLKLQLWDTSGQERFHCISRSYYRGADGVVLVYDVARPDTVEMCQKWLQNARESCPEGCPIFLIGNKTDLEERVTDAEAEEMADRNGLTLLKTSCKTGDGFPQLLSTLSIVMCEAAGDPLTGDPSASLKPASRSTNEDLADEDREDFDVSVLERSYSFIPGAPRRKGKKLAVEKADVNVLNLSMAQLTEEAPLMTGDPAMCKNCGVLVSSLATVSFRPARTGRKKEKAETAEKGVPCLSAPSLCPKFVNLEGGEGHADGQEDHLLWRCAFCAADNFLDMEKEELPSAATVDYLVQPAPPVGTKGRRTIFCIDVSGSMCVTEEVETHVELRGGEKRARANARLIAEQGTTAAQQVFPGQKRGMRLVSRLQCVQAAVDKEIRRLTREDPSAIVGIVTFGSDVTFYGDCSKRPTTIAGDVLRDWDRLLAVCEEADVRKAVKETADDLLATLWDIEEGGATALGPAALLGVCLAGKEAGSHVVLCTDGLANVGLGSLDDNEAEQTMFYTELAEQAKLRGVSVSLVSLIGSECRLQRLVVVTEETAGTVERLSAASLASSSLGLMAKPVLAYGAMAMIVLPVTLRFRTESEDESGDSRLNRSWLVKDMANVTAETEASVRFAFRSGQRYRRMARNELFFQVQILYTLPSGEQRLRVSTVSLGVTSDRKVAEDNAVASVVGKHATQTAAKLARDGKHREARMHVKSAQRFVERTAKGDIHLWKAANETFDELVADVENSVGRQLDEQAVFLSNATAKPSRFW